MPYLYYERLLVRVRSADGCRSFLIFDMLADSNNSQQYFYPLYTQNMMKNMIKN